MTCVDGDGCGLSALGMTAALRAADPSFFSLNAEGESLHHCAVFCEGSGGAVDHWME